MAPHRGCGHLTPLDIVEHNKYCFHYYDSQSDLPYLTLLAAGCEVTTFNIDADPLPQTGFAGVDKMLAIRAGIVVGKLARNAV